MTLIKKQKTKIILILIVAIVLFGVKSYFKIGEDQGIFTWKDAIISFLCSTGLIIYIAYVFVKYVRVDTESKEND